MSKAVLISIRPEWCELILKGKKTIEIRKTKPNLDVPFKVYVYCTNNKLLITPNHFYYKTVPKCTENGIRSIGAYDFLNGKVIGEFVCNRVTNLFTNSRFWMSEDDVLHTCLSAAEIRKYANGANVVYGWRISDLAVYDKPKELSEFTGLRKTKFGMEPVTVTRPPQSWCYVEEM